MATTFCKKNAKIANQDQGSQNIINKKETSGANSPSALGSRTTPKDGYKFVAGSDAIFQATFTDTDKPIRIDTGKKPKATIFSSGQKIAEIYGELTPGQTYEYMFTWIIPIDINPRNLFQVQYEGDFGGVPFVWGSEFFEINSYPQNIKLKTPAYATVDQIRRDKPNIDAYLPDSLAEDKAARDTLLQEYLYTSSIELNGQLNLRDFHSVYNDNFNLYVRYHAVWTILGSQLGEEGSAVSDKVLSHWEKRWKHTLKQIKMHSQLSNIPSGRA